jgi:hypothetical protein
MGVATNDPQDFGCPAESGVIYKAGEKNRNPVDEFAENVVQWV